MIKHHGYLVTTYEVVSKDGYKSTIHRIPGRKGNKVVQSLKEAGKLKPVLLLHGVGGSSRSWVVSGRDGKGKAIPYRLADSGWDVWILSARGSHPSSGHVWMDSETEKEYWNFSFEEIAIFDVPAIIDFIMSDRRSSRKIALIGWSQGTSISLTALA